jgi:transposase
MQVPTSLRGDERKCCMEPAMSEKRYPTDVNDTTWLFIEPLVRQKPGKGRKRTVNIRLVVNAIFYLNKTGCQWEMLPHDFPDYRHVN